MRVEATFVVLFFVGLLVISSRADGPTESKDCKFWHQLAYNLSHIGNLSPAGYLRFACNSTCNSIRCSGHMDTMNVPVKIDADIDFCFGIRLNHCDDPVDMNYYLDMPSFQIYKNGTISHNDTFELPAVAQSSRVTMVILVEMVPVNSSFVLFGITGKMKLSLAGIEEFPYSETIFPSTLIDVPPCTDKGEARPPFNGPQKCVGPKPGITSTVGPKKTTTVTTVINSKTFNKSCEFGVGQCEKNEMCQAPNSKSRSGICVCKSNAHFNGVTGLCQSEVTSQKPGKSTTKSVTGNSSVTNAPSVTHSSARTQPGSYSTVKPPVTTRNSTVTHIPGVTQSSKGEKSGTNMTPVIIGAVFGGLLLIVVIVGVVIFIGRRRRQALLRGSHQLLMDNEDEDDRNLVI